MTKRTAPAATARPTALITGASSGIGYSLALEFARHGHDVILVARDLERLQELARRIRAEHSVTASTLSLDLCRPGAADELHGWIRKQKLSVDILVNNAGFDVYGPLAETSAEREQAMLSLNIQALTMLCKLFLPRMQKRGRGRIMNLGSTGSFIPTPLNAVYCATKAYVLSLSAALAEECRGTGVTVSCICPGATHTRFHERAAMEEITLMKFGVMEADYVARQAYRACMAGRRLLVVGPWNKICMFTLAFLPLSWRVKVAGIFIR